MESRIPRRNFPARGSHGLRLVMSPLPVFVLDDPATGTRSFPTGRPALLCFVKEDCPTCGLSMPLIEQAHRAFGDVVDVWAVGQDTEGNATLVSRHGLTLPMLDDSALRVSYEYDLDTVPTVSWPTRRAASSGASSASGARAGRTCTRSWGESPALPIRSWTGAGTRTRFRAAARARSSRGSPSGWRRRPRAARSVRAESRSGGTTTSSSSCSTRG